PLLQCLEGRCDGVLPRRHMEVTCGGFRTPRGGRCSPERRLIRSTGHLTAKTEMASLRGGAGRRGVAKRPPLFFGASARGVLPLSYALLCDEGVAEGNAIARRTR